MTTSSIQRWTKKRLTAAEQRTAAHEKALAQCATGDHRETPTFRPGEVVCLICSRVVYCPDCLSENHLPLPQAHRAFPLACSTHRKAQEVQA
jgi:hypothetical protein